MAKIVRLPTRRPTAERVDALAAQLSRVEGAYSPDLATMDAIVAAERRLLAALAKATAVSLSEISLKLDAVARRAVAAEGHLTDGDLDLLQSALADMQLVAPETAVA